VTSVVQYRPRSVAMQQISVVRSCVSFSFYYAFILDLDYVPIYVILPHPRRILVPHDFLLPDSNHVNPGRCVPADFSSARSFSGPCCSVF
jgi:hypothetical protein